MKIDFRLYCISGGSAGKKPLEETILRAAKAGVKAFQIREKTISDAELRALATDIISLVKPFNISLFINSREKVAEELGVHVHLPEQDIYKIEAIRRARGGNVLIGASAHSLATARAAQGAGVDLILFGPVFETESKKQFGPPQGVDALKKICSTVTIPVFAIGGITPENAGECLAAGAHGVACISAVMNADDPKAAVQQFAANMPLL